MLKMPKKIVIYIVRVIDNMKNNGVWIGEELASKAIRLVDDE